MNTRDISDYLRAKQDVFDKLYRFLQEYNNRMINNDMKPTIEDFHEQAEDTIHH